MVLNRLIKKYAPPVFWRGNAIYGAGKLQIRETAVHKMIEKKAQVSHNPRGLNSSLAQYSIHSQKAAASIATTASMILNTTRPSAAVIKYARNRAISTYKISVNRRSN